MTADSPRSRVEPAVEERFALVVFREFWKSSRTMLIYAIALMVIGSFITELGKSHQFSPSFLIIAAVLLVITLGLRSWTMLHYVKVGEQGLEFHAFRRIETLDFELIRQVRCQPLEQFFDSPNRRERLPSNLRRFRHLAACTVRPEVDTPRLERLSKLAGRKTVIDQDLIVLVANAAGLEKALLPHLRRRAPAPSQKSARRR